MSPLRCGVVLPALMLAVPMLAQVPSPQSPVADTTARMQTAIVWVELWPPGNGWVDKLATQHALPTLLNAEIAKARAMGRTPFVEIGAAWCGGCVTLETAIHRQDPVMQSAFAGAYLIHLDFDDWNLGELLTGNTIPAIVALDSAGEAVGQLNGIDPAAITAFIQAHRWPGSPRPGATPRSATRSNARVPRSDPSETLQRR